MFDMWSNVTSKFEGHTSLQTNVQTNGGQTQSSGSIKGNRHNITINTFKKYADTSTFHHDYFLYVGFE